MADYTSTTVFRNPIPVKDITPLERMILSDAFDMVVEAGELWFSACEGINLTTKLTFDDASAILTPAPIGAAHRQFPQEPLERHVLKLLREARLENCDTIMLDLSEKPFTWEEIVQGIVRRSASLTYIAIVTSMNCTKMDPDGFGGSAMLITKDQILERHTDEILDEWIEALKPSTPSPQTGNHASPNLSVQGVRAAIIGLIDADTSPTTLCADMISDDDIRCAWKTIASRTELAGDHSQAELRAALEAVRLAEHRLSLGHQLAGHIPLQELKGRG